MWESHYASAAHVTVDLGRQPNLEIRAPFCVRKQALEAHKRTHKSLILSKHKAMLIIRTFRPELASEFKLIQR